MSRRVGPRGLEVLRDELSGRDVAIVRHVADLRLMTGGQIEAIHFGTDAHLTTTAGARAARRVLERLTRDGLLVRLERRIGGIRAGSTSFIYALGAVGHRLLQETDIARPRLREPSTQFVDHTLAIAQLVVDLTLAARHGDHELIGLQTEPWCWRSFPTGLGSQGTLRPDLFTTLGTRDFELHWFVEVDRGTEHLPTLIKKCRIYDAYYQTGREQAERGVFPRVAWLVPTKRRFEQLRQAIDRDRQLHSDMFVVGLDDAALTTLTDQAA
jgi:hypothetical protein